MTKPKEPSELSAPDLIPWIEVIEHLVRLGWLLWKKRSAKAVEQTLRAGGPGPEVRKALKKFQEFHNLLPSGAPDDITLHYLRLPRYCGTPDSLGVDATCRWPHKEITWRIVRELPGSTMQQMVADVEWCFEQVAAVCDLDPSQVFATANILLTTHGGPPMGGPGGVLADSMLPCGFRANQTVTQRYDTAEVWGFGPLPVPNGRIPFRLVSLHEILHGLGVPHAPQGVLALMGAFLNVALRGLQEWDREQLVSRYGQPRLPPAPGPLKGYRIHLWSDRPPVVEPVQTGVFGA